MGDFEDIFGAGADIVSIIHNIDGPENDNDDYADCYRSGASIARAKSFYELTGTFGFLPKNVFREDAFPAMEERKYEIFKKEAQILADALDDAREDVTGEYPQREDDDDYTAKVSRLFTTATGRLCETLAEFETFLILVTCNLRTAAILVRDTSINNGMFGPGLSTHAVMLERFYVARLGTLQMQGPFLFERNCDWEEPFEWSSFADGGPGQEIQAISKGVSGKPFAKWEELKWSYIDDARTWVKANRQSSDGNSFGHVANNARRAEVLGLRAIRAWSDKQEQDLCRLIQQLVMAILPADSQYHISLEVGAFGANFSTFFPPRDGTSEAHCVAIDAALGLIDLSSFRGRSFTGRGRSDLEIILFEEQFNPRSAEELLIGREVLLDLVEQKRLDRAAVQAAIMKEDWKHVAALLNPDFVDWETPLPSLSFGVSQRDDRHTYPAQLREGVSARAAEGRRLIRQ